MEIAARTDRSTVRRHPERSSYNLEAVRDILSEAVVCHVGFVLNGEPFVIPMGFGIDADDLLLHGSTKSRLVGALSRGVAVCVTVTILDGMVLASSAFSHSMNYRSVIILGTPRVVDDPGEKLAALRAIVEHLVPGRWSELPLPTDQELHATAVLAFALSECSAKVRRGSPKLSEVERPTVWTGEVPLRLVALAPIPDPRAPQPASTPQSVHRLLRTWTSRRTDRTAARNER